MASTRTGRPEFALTWNSMDNGGTRTNPMNSADLAPAEVDGQPLNEWIAANEIGKSTAYAFLAIVKGRGIEPEKTRGNGTKPLVMLSGAVLDLMNLLLADHRRGLSLPEIKRKYTSNASAIAPVAPVAMAVQHDEPANDPESLLRRLEAASMAQATGLPLTKPELHWILGTGINSETAAMARCRIEKRGRRWTLLPPAG